MKQALILFFFLLSLSLTAQNVTVNGKLVSAADRDPLPYATISVSREATPANAIKNLPRGRMELSPPLCRPENIYLPFILWE